MSGVYNYHPTIDEPQSFPIQTASQQKPFYFGGSQVPINLNLKPQASGDGVGKKHLLKMRFHPRTPLRKV
jgi:hypothetical protein